MLRQRPTCALQKAAPPPLLQPVTGMAWHVLAQGLRLAPCGWPTRFQQ